MTNQLTISRRTALVALTAAAAAGALLAPAIATAASGAQTAAGAAPLSANGGATRHPGDDTDAVRAAVEDGAARNVILLVGDGMGDSEITIARNYQYGAAGRLPGIDALPLTGQYTTYSLHRSGSDRGLPQYAPDSSATGSAWATGTKTYNGAVSVDIDGRPQPTVLEIAKANGLKTGNVSTAEIQDATPAVQVAHVRSRRCYAPSSSACGSDALQSGGLGSISEQLIGTRADVTLGGGAASFAEKATAGQWKGDTLVEQARERGYQVVDSANGLAAVTRATQKSPVLGLFAPGNLPTRYAATTATVGGAHLAPVTCTANPDRLPSSLSLAALTTKAIALLSGNRGFFLQVEGASIDKRDHKADACGQIGETIDFDEAVQAALAFAAEDGETLVLVTADHGHSSQIVGSTPPTSLSTALTTADGSVMKISYGTARSGSSQQHTGTQVRIAGAGPGAANVVGLTDQTDTFFTMTDALQLDRNTVALSAQARVSVAAAVRPGAPVLIGASGFRGDRQVTGALQPGGASSGIVDLDRGAATVTITAPRTTGDYTVTVAGAQTRARATATFSVRR